MAQELDVLKQKIVDRIKEIKFKDFFAMASKCSSGNKRILLVVKPETYNYIEKTVFLDKEYFSILVDIMKHTINEHIELIVKMPKSPKGDEGELHSIDLGDEIDLDLDLDDLDDLEDLLDDFMDDSKEVDNTKNLTFISSKALKLLLILENKDDYLCIRKWILEKKIKNATNITILKSDKNGIVELLESDYHKVIKKSMEQKKSVANLGMDPSSEEFKKFSEIMISVKKYVSPTDSEINSFIDFLLADEEFFFHEGKFNIKSFINIPSFIVKNFGSLTQRLKEQVENKDEIFKEQIDSIAKNIDGLDNDQDLIFFILNEAIKDLSFKLIQKLYTNNESVQSVFNSNLKIFEDVSSIINDSSHEQHKELKLSVKSLLMPYLNKGWSNIDDEKKSNEEEEVTE